MKEIYDLAEQYHNDGNNCVESVVKACNDGLQLGLPDVAIRMVSGMGGGIGRSGCVCGALSGSCPGYQLYRWQIGSVRKASDRGL